MNLLPGERSARTSVRSRPKFSARRCSNHLPRPPTNHAYQRHQHHRNRTRRFDHSQRRAAGSPSLTRTSCDRNPGAVREEQLAFATDADSATGHRSTPALMGRLYVPTYKTRAEILRDRLHEQQAREERLRRIRADRLREAEARLRAEGKLLPVRVTL